MTRVTDRGARLSHSAITESKHANGDDDMKYFIFQIMIRAGNGGKFLDVVAINIDAALADVVAAYGNVEVITWCQK